MRQINIVTIQTKAFPEAKDCLEPLLENISVRTKKDLEKAAQEKIDKRVKILESADFSPLSARVVAIGVGLAYVNDQDSDFDTTIDKCEFRVLEIENDNEADLLSRFQKLVNNHANQFVTFNGREFDFPFMVFRGAINKVQLKLPTYYKNTFDGHFDLSQYLYNMALIEKLDSTIRDVYLNQWIKYFGIRLPQVDQSNWKEHDFMVNDVQNRLFVIWNIFKLFKHDFEGRFNR